MNTRPFCALPFQWAWFALVVFTSGLHAATAPARMELFDAQPLLKADLSRLDERRRTWDQQQLLSALQGLVNRNEPGLYCLAVGSAGGIDRYWLRQLQRPGQWLASTRAIEQRDLLALLKRHRTAFKGVVVWDERVPATALVAATAAGADDLLPVRFDPDAGSLYHQLVEAPDGPRLSVRLRLLNDDNSAMFTGRRSGSAKCDALLWAVDHYLKSGKCDAAHLAYYPDAFWLSSKSHVPPVRTLLLNHDYYIAHRAFFFDLSPWEDEPPNDDPHQPLGTDHKTLLAVLAAAEKAAGDKIILAGGFTPWDQKYTSHTGGRHEGVPTEWRYAQILSCFNAAMDADAPGLHAMANASFFQHYPLKDRYPQKNIPTEATLRARGYLSASGRVVPRPYAAIYVGDYDSAAWLYQKFPDVWDDPNRGSIPLGWAFNPALAERFPVGLALARASASPNDTFIAGDSGYAYLNPGSLVPPRPWSNLPSGLDAWETCCTKAYKKWDLRITGFVIDGDAPAMSEAVRAAYARFSPGGVVAQKIPERSIVRGVPFLRMGSDLSNPRDGAQAISQSLPAGAKGAQFGIFRTILWTPTMHKEMFDLLHRERPDLVIVEPHTLFELLRRDLDSR